jgi:hypothetical protein
MGIALVERMLGLHEKLYQRRMDVTDAEIYTLAYELYGLTEEKIAIVERRDR